MGTSTRVRALLAGGWFRGRASASAQARATAGQRSLGESGAGVRVRSFVGHTAPIVRIVLADDGLRAMTLAGDGSLLLWDLASGASRPLGTSGEAIVDALFSADGERLYSVGRDGVVRLWHDDLPRDEAGLRAAWTDLLSSTR